MNTWDDDRITSFHNMDLIHDVMIQIEKSVIDMSNRIPQGTDEERKLWIYEEVVDIARDLKNEALREMTKNSNLFRYIKRV